MSVALEITCKVLDTLVQSTHTTKQTKLDAAKAKLELLKRFSVTDKYINFEDIIGDEIMADLVLRGAKLIRINPSDPNAAKTKTELKLLQGAVVLLANNGQFEIDS